MAFPLDTTNLLAYLRVSYISLTEDEMVKRVIRPLNITSDAYKIPHITVPDSPPIMFDVARHIKKSVDHHNNIQPRKRIRNKDHGIKKKPIPKPSSPEPQSVELTNELENQDELIEQPTEPNNLSFGLLYSKTIRPKKNIIPKPNITRFFNSAKAHKDKSAVDSDSDSDGSINTMPLLSSSDPMLELIEEDQKEDNTDDGDLTETEKKLKQYDTSDAITIDSDFGVPVDSSGQVHSKDKLLSKKSDLPEDTDGEDLDYTEEYSDEELDDEDLDDEDLDDASSTDSAFTDIEADSLLDSSMMLDSYDKSSNADSYSFDGQHTASLFKKNRKKKRSNSFDPSLSRTSATSMFKHTSSQVSIFSNAKVLGSGNTKSHTSLNMRRPTMNFDKVSPHLQAEAPSKLTSLIQNKFKSSNTNPLSYYSFADSSIIMTTPKTTVDVFIPPRNKPVLKKLSLNDNIVLVDCIGFILWNLSRSPDYDKSDSSYLNPNHWRLELVDEDGENYGSFGILERTRLLSSYNNPREVALCRVVNEQEILKNEQQTPLPLEFKQMISLDQKRNSIGQALEGVSTDKDKRENKIELNIVIRNMTLDIIVFHASETASIGDVLREVCKERELPISKYTLKEVLPRELNGITHNHQQLGITLLEGNLLTSVDTIGKNLRTLNENELVTTLGNRTLELVPDSSRLNGLNDEMISAITPSSKSSYTMQSITPDKKLLGERLLTLRLEAAEKVTHVPRQDKWTSDSIKGAIRSNKYLDDIITGKNPQLPTNLNSIYFKWKVFRKKTTILNKIEKSLIIDGDYIHLTPSDDIVYKQNPTDNPLLHQTDGQGSHHHHLYYYNYNNHYKQLVMKTSSFHITQIVKLKQYKNSKNPNHFKIVIEKQTDTSSAKDSTVKKKYDLEAVSVTECEEIIEKLNWVLQVYSMSNLNATR